MRDGRDRRDNRGGPRRSDGGGFRNDFGGGRGGFSGPRPMHKATCADCGAECEVPFVPKEGRPVYCKECFSKHKPQRF